MVKKLDKVLCTFNKLTEIKFETPRAKDPNAIPADAVNCRLRCIISKGATVNN